LYCSEPRLAFNRIVVTRYRINLEQERYAASTINLRLAAVRRLAYEAADAGLLSPDLAAGTRRVKGAKKHGVRLGNWLTSEQGKRLLAVFDRDTVRGKRDSPFAVLAKVRLVTRLVSLCSEASVWRHGNRDMCTVISAIRAQPA